MLETVLTSIATGLIGLFVGHRLSIGKDSANRRRDFRAAIRSVSIRFDDVNWINFYKIYQESVPHVKELVAKISDDISWRSKSGFIEYRDLYCGFKHSDIELPRPSNPAGMDEYMRANKRKREEAKASMQATLEKIARYAK